MHALASVVGSLDIFFVGVMLLLTPFSTCKVWGNSMQGGQVMRVLGVFQNFYAVIFIMRLCGYPHNFVS